MSAAVELPTTPGSVIEAKPPGRKKAFLMALRTDGWWQRLDIPVEESSPFRDVRVLFDAGASLREQIAGEIEAAFDAGCDANHDCEKQSGDWNDGHLFAMERAARIVRGGDDAAAVAPRETKD